MILLLNSARFIGAVAEVSKYSVVFITFCFGPCYIDQGHVIIKVV